MGALNNIGVASSGSYHPPATPHMADYSYGLQVGDIILLVMCIGLVLNLVGISFWIADSTKSIDAPEPSKNTPKLLASSSEIKLLSAPKK